MIAYELLAKLRHLTLTGVDEDGDLEFIGTMQSWNQVAIEEENILREFDLKKAWHAK